MANNKFRFYAFKLAAAMIVIFILQMVVPGFTAWFVLNQSAMEGQFWRVLTSVFLHGGLGHLAYNMFALILFGSIVEKLIGGGRFLALFFISGIVASLISVNYYTSALGASGAIFGIIGALVVLKPWMVVWTFGMPMPMIIAGAIWAAGDVIGIFNPSNVANIAHLVGMGFGILYGTYFRARRTREKRRGNTRMKIPDRIMKRWEDVYLG